MQSPSAFYRAAEICNRPGGRSNYGDHKKRFVARTASADPHMLSTRLLIA